MTHVWNDSNELDYDRLLGTGYLNLRYLDPVITLDQSRVSMLFARMSD